MLGDVLFEALQDIEFYQEGFPIVFAKFWRLRSGEGPCPERTPQLLSETFVHNELMRRCLLRRQSESLPHGVRGLFTTLARCRIKRRDTVGELKSAEICVSHIPSLKAKRLGKLPREKVLLEP
jgi:hypothetical protein